MRQAEQKEDEHMIQTNKVIGFYTDVFGVEHDEYELVERYTVRYKGFYFEGDKTQGWNSVNCDSFEEAMEIYNHIPGSSIKDNEYDVILENGEWS
jgi:hypothetical protein